MPFRRAGWTTLVSAILGANVWLYASRFVPILAGGEVTYRFLAAPPAIFAIGTACAAVLLLGLHAALGKYTFRNSGGPSDSRHLTDGRYLAPLTLLAVNLSALAGLIPALNGRLFPWLYLTVDLRLWITACVLLVFFLELDARLAGVLRTRLKGAMRISGAGCSRASLEMAIVTAAVAFACFSSPRVRFGSGLHGDEPKYLRYCEGFYQGRGFDVSNLRNIDDLPLDRHSSLLRNVTSGLALVPRGLAHVSEDLIGLIEHGFQQQFNRATYLGGFFVEGRDGGVYQAHGPGLSVILMPGYYIDRHLLSWQSATYARGEPAYIFPDRLVFTNFVALLLYAFLGVAIFRLLLRLTSEQGLSFGLALVALVTPPISAFAFQFYPEIAAAIIVTTVVRRMLFEPDMTSIGAAMTGLAIGYLPWLHVRYLAIMGILLIWGALDRRSSIVHRRSSGLSGDRPSSESDAGNRPSSRRWTMDDRRWTTLAFLAGGAVTLGAHCLFAYYATGSLLPTAFYDAGGSMLRLASVGPGLFAFAFDGTFGLLPHAPVLLISLMGSPALVRRQPRVALLCGLLIAAAFATAAAKDFTAALGSPGRFVIVVMPLFAVSLAEAVRRFRHSQLFRVSFGLALVLSLQTAWAYNWSHDKHIGPIVDSSFSGWKLNLLFPEFRGQNWYEEGFQSLLLPVWIAIVVAVVALPYIFGRRRRVSRPAAAPLPYVAVATYAVFALAICLLNPLSVRQFEPSYLMGAPRASAAVEAYLRGTDPWFEVLTTRKGIVRPQNQPPQELTLTVSRKPAPPGEPPSFRLEAGQDVLFKLAARYDQPWRARGLLAVSYGDGETAEPVSFVSEITLSHRYARPGRYQVSMDLLAARQWTSARTEVRVSAPVTDVADAEAIDVATIEGVPAEAGASPATLKISRLEVAEGRLCVESSPIGRRLSEASPAQVWIVTNDGGRWLGRNYGTLQPGERCLRIPTEEESAGPLRRPDPLYTGILLTYGSPLDEGKVERSQLSVIWWPSREALAGSSIVFHPGAKTFWSEIEPP